MGSKFSSNLKYIRENKGISKNKLGELVGVNQSTITRWETNEIKPSIDNVEEVAKALNVPLPDLLIKDLRFDNSYTENKTKTLNILYDKLKDLPEDKQKMILNVTEAVMKDIDDQLDNK